MRADKRRSFWVTPAGDAVGLTVLVAAMLSASGAWAQDLGLCGSLANGFGPFDYRKERGNNLRLVESAHFTPSVESLAGSVTGYIGGDIDYTLRAFPNHHRALIATARLAERLNLDPVPRMKWDVDCYFRRATAWTPDDAVVRMLYASFLNKKKRKEDALRQLNVAKQYAADNPFTHFNLGMSYLELGSFEEALVHAHKALELGFPRTELKDRLVALNKWKDPEPAEAAANATPSASAAAATP